MRSREEAERGGALLLEQLGPGWTLRVHENCGWHYAAQKAGMTISPVTSHANPPRYGVLLNRNGGSQPTGAQEWHVDGSFLDPREAVRVQLKRLEGLRAYMDWVCEQHRSTISVMLDNGSGTG